MDFVLYNLRLKELVAIVKENRMFFDEFVGFLHTHGYSSILEFIQEGSDEKAIATIAAYLASPTKANLYDGLLRPYSNSKAKWYFLAWLLIKRCRLAEITTFAWECSRKNRCRTQVISCERNQEVCRTIIP